MAARRALRLALGERLLDTVRTERVATWQLFRPSRRTHADGAVVRAAIHWRLMIPRPPCFNVKTLASIESIMLRYKVYAGIERASKR